MLKEIKRPLKELKNEFYAIEANPDARYGDPYGPSVSRPELEKQLPQGNWLILTRVAEVMVS